MRPWNRVKVAKCQMLVTGFFVLLLSLSVATTAIFSYCGPHFTVISCVSSEKNPYKAMHHWAFYVGIGLTGLLTLGAALSTAATMREAQGLMAGGFLCFTLAFCTLLQVAFWRFRNPTQVENAVLDTYDLVYDQAMNSMSAVRRQELAAIQDTDCLQGIQNFLRTHEKITSMLTSIGLALTVYAILLSSFLWFAIHSGCNLDRKGKYSLTPRAHGHQHQEPSLFRHSQGGMSTSTL
ncbi:tetraspanin-32 isoform X3 [Tupaia chinensis]|uniref:tetraspanin-32 isoform X3 n=1 Tax=Tupaia chinensis TaxID=246437 RepID=UPI0003C90CFF|nr:tetraspanin-32 isoform X3 [Tupaia chinensis]